jgi:hypothetical protein
MTQKIFQNKNNKQVYMVKQKRFETEIKDEI